MKRAPSWTPLLLALPLWLAGPGRAAAQTPVSVSLIGEGALAQGAGSLALNQSAGSGNAQANLAVLGLSEGALQLGVDSKQQAAPAFQGKHAAALAAIDARAFSGASGLIALNQAAGDGNMQVNLALVGVASWAELSIDQLGVANVAPAPDGAPDTSTALRAPRATIADSAFAGARGIVQVSQLAGAGNSTANIFALRVSVGTQ